MVLVGSLYIYISLSLSLSLSLYTMYSTPCTLYHIHDTIYYMPQSDPCYFTRSFGPLKLEDRVAAGCESPAPPRRREGPRKRAPLSAFVGRRSWAWRLFSDYLQITCAHVNICVYWAVCIHNTHIYIYVYIYVYIYM